MTTAAASSWAPVEPDMPRARWWGAVTSGVIAPVLLTPLGDIAPEPWRVSATIALAVVAVILGLGTTFSHLGRPRAGSRPGAGSVLVCVAAVLALVGGTPLAVLTGDATLPAAAGLAAAAHLVAARMLRSLIAVVPGADAPRAAPRTVGSFLGDVVTEAQDPWHRFADRLVRALPWPAGLFAALGFGAAFLGGPALTPGWPLLPTLAGAKAALAVLLVASPASFVLAHLLPGRAARDRGRELGIVYGDVDLRRVARMKTLVLDPLQTVTDDLPRLVRVHTHGRLQVTAALQAAASVAAGSAVPTHRAVVAAARGRGIELRPTMPADTDSPSAAVRHRYLKNTVVTLGPAQAFDRVPADLEGHSLYVGWGGVARAAFDLVPQVRSEVLSEWSEVAALRLRPVFVSADPAALAHVGEAMEMPQADVHADRGDTWRQVTGELAHSGVTGVLGSHGLHPDGRSLIGFEALPERTDGPTHGDASVRLESVGVGDATRAVGLARKTGRVTAQCTVAAVVLQVALALAAVAGVIHPTVAGITGATLPILVAANALRPRSFARTGDTT